MFSSQREKERQEQLRSVAFELGLKFELKEEFGMKTLLKDFKLFRKGGSKKITNLLHQTAGLMEEKINIMDYRYTISTGKTTVTHHQTVFFLQSKLLALPEMLLKPENFFHKIGAWLGLQQDIDFEEHPEFSDRFLLQGEDEHRIRNIMQDRVRKFFVIEKDWCMESVGFFLIFYKERSLASPDYIKALYKKGMTLYNYFKEEKPFP